MKPSTLRTALMIATISVPFWSSATWADDAHHPTQSTVAQSQATTAATSAGLSEATIKALQEALNKQGIAVKADGVLNDETRAAIKTYQAQHHLAVTGEPDKATLDKLGIASTQTAEPAPTQSAPQPRAHGQPGQPQGGIMTNCPMMQGGQAAQGGMMNCPMMPRQAQPSTPGQPGQTQGMGQGMGPGMMHGMGSGQMQPGQMQRPPTAFAQAAPTTPPAASPPAAQPGQMPGGMMMNCPMMQGQMQGLMQMMQAMQGQMQGMMQMMEAMQRQTQPGQAQPGAK